ncbi:hypothetical protein [Burkholderia pseudomallei]|uniref:hypothetical protein n=1 Tax=Burkholderia pseudomallei TaxID=28450 RepID=UPI00130D76E0|nr:hypothetical protein [Burkholderia pseudomallei]
MYDLFLSRLAAVNNNLEKYMPSGIEVDGISFNELALVNRPEHAAVLGRIFTSWSLIESSITALLGLLFIVRRGYGIPDLPPTNRASRSLVKFVFGEEDEHEEALYGTANHRVSEGSRGRYAGQGTVQEAWVQ